MNSAIESFVVCDPSGRIVHANTAAIELAGGSLAGRAFGDAFLFESNGLTDVVSQVRSGGAVRGLQLRMLRKDGNRELVVTAKPLEGTPGFAVILMDITERTEADRKLRDLNESLERIVEDRTILLTAANKELEGFTYSVSHDLRGPLRSVMGAAMILREDYGETMPEGADRELDKITAAARKMSNLIDDLLRFSRLGRQQMNLREISLSDLAAEVVGDFVGRGEVKADQFEIEPEMTAFGDPQLLGLVLENLFGNSIKFARSQTPIRVRFGSEVQDGRNQYTVRDNGIGFSPEYAEKIFLPFERLHTDRDYAGSGIGLANVQRILARHGGRVWADGSPGEGATFTFTLADPMDSTQ